MAADFSGLQYLPTAVVVLDEDAAVRYANQAAENLLGAAARSLIGQPFLPLFEPDPGTPLRERLMGIARAFYTMVAAPEAVAGHRMLCSPQMVGSGLPRRFWEAGPVRVQGDFVALLERRIAAGELEIPDVARAAGQFFSLLKGEPHAHLVFGGPQVTAEETEAHLAAAVEMFLRAYAVRDPAAATKARTSPRPARR